MMASKSAVRPVWQVFADGGEKLDAQAFLPAVASYFSDNAGKLVALPFNISTPILFYNKDAFRKAKLDPESPPRTWYEMPKAMGELLGRGLRMRVHHGLALVGADREHEHLAQPGFRHARQRARRPGREADLQHAPDGAPRVDALVLGARGLLHLQRAAHPGRAALRAGRVRDDHRRAPPATPQLRSEAKFDFGAAQLPYYDDIKGAPHHSLISGGGLWAMAGKTHAEYRGMARFLAWLARPEIQAEWHQRTGYVPVTRAAYEQTAQSGFYKANPGHEIAIKQLLLNQPTRESRGIRLGEFAAIRAIIEEELEAVWDGKVEPKLALDQAAERGDVLLRKFEREQPGRPRAGRARARPARPAASREAGRQGEISRKSFICFGYTRNVRRRDRTSEARGNPCKSNTWPLRLASVGLLSTNAQAQTEIQWWHSMGGALGEALNGLANKFNASQKDYKVVPMFKGRYPESMTAAIAAFRAGNAPHLLQVFEVGTATMMAAKGAIVPVAKVMADAKEPFDPKAYLPTVAGYYTDTKGNMLSFPFNSSTVVFYINKDAFKKAGLDPNKAPKTWKELIAAAEKLKAAGQDCVYTTGWPSWMHIENFSAWHNVPIGTKENGMGGIDTVFTINSPLHVRHITMLGDMAKKGLFTYAGRTNQADAKFSSGECAMLTVSAGAQAASSRRTPSSTGRVNFMPYHDDVKGAPQNSIIGGASLWVMGGKKPDEYKGVAKFFAFLSQARDPDGMAHQAPATCRSRMAAYEMTRKSGFYDKNPGADIAVKQLTNKPPTANSKGLRFGNFVQGREVIEEETGGRVLGQEGRQDGARRRGEARQRDPAQVRGGQQVSRGSAS